MISHGKDIKVFSGNANPKLAEEICKLMGTKLGEAEVGTFSDGEIFVSLYETVRGSDVFVVQSTCTPVNNNLMELLIMIDALKRASAGRITAVIPYYGYARQDRKAKARDPITAKLVANMLTAAGADRVLTMDLHASQIQGFFDIPVDNLAGNPIFVDYYAKKYGSECENMMVVSPDVGSVSRARAFAQKLHMNLAIVDKRRQKANSCEVMNVIGDVRDKDCILFDDMVDTGGSLCNAAKALIEVGGAKSVQACASHGVLSGPAIDRINDSVITELALLDTIPANAASYRAALEEQGFTVTDEYYAQYCNGGYYKQFLRPLMGGDPAPEAVERVHDRKKELYSSCLPMVRPNTSLLAILQAMKAAGHDLACVTTGSRKNATEVLEYFHCADWFGVFITGEDVVRSKPDPEGYLKAMAHFGVTPAETMIFEDSGPGLEAARASGATVYKVEAF